MSPLTLPPCILTKSFPFGSTVKKAEAIRIRDPRPRETQSTDGLRSEEGTLNRARIIRLAENPILRSRKRLNSDCSEASIQGVPSGYGFCVPCLADFPFLIFNHSRDREERQKENGGVGQNGGQRADV